MTLTDLENFTLLSLQQPNANPGSAPNWGIGEFTQAQVDFCINRGYSRLCSDLSDLELMTNTLVFPTAAQQYMYQIQNAQVAIGTYATAALTFGGIAAAGQTPSITISGIVLQYTVKSGDSLASIVQAFINLINNSVLTPPQSNGLSPATPALNTAGNVLNIVAGGPGPGANALIAAAGSGTLTITPSLSNLTGGTTANQPIHMVRRVFYQPLGQLYRLELEPGARLISWEEMNRKTGAGYLLNFSYATNPDYCAVDPLRQSLQFYPGPFTVGDQITVQYCPIITSNPSIPATQWGYLNNATDVPLVPEDAQDCIWEQAVSFLQPKAREYEGGRLYSQIYKEDLQRVRDNYTRDSAGDALVLKPVSDVLMTSGWDSWLSVGPGGY